MQFFYLLSSQFRQKASSWINKTLLLIKQHITYMNISRYANIDKFVNIRYIFLLARRAYSWLFQLAQLWKLLAPGVGLGDFLTPWIQQKISAEEKDTGTDMPEVCHYSQTFLMWTSKGTLKHVTKDRWSLNTGLINMKCTERKLKLMSHIA